MVARSFAACSLDDYLGREPFARAAWPGIRLHGLIASGCFFAAVEVLMDRLYLPLLLLPSTRSYIYPTLQQISENT